jgi:hypothetical protein
MMDKEFYMGTKYKVNIWAFASDYLVRFSDDDSLWPSKRKIKSAVVAKSSFSQGK